MFFFSENIDTSLLVNREKKTTQSQYLLYVEYMEANRELLYNKLDPTMDSKALEKKWEDLRSILNCCGKGPQKTITQWQSVSLIIIIPLVCKLYNFHVSIFRFLQTGNTKCGIKLEKLLKT